MQFLDADTPLPQGALRLANNEDVMAHAEALRDARAVWLQFPAWTDGRAYSQAVVLRGRIGYRGPITATGEVLVDMLPLLRRCGFDNVMLAPGQRQASAEAALAGFTDHYQADQQQPLPRYARSEAPL